jgi:hypothetical protein
MGDEIVRWKVEPLERSRRGLDERLLMASPGSGGSSHVGCGVPSAHPCVEP